MHQLAWLSAGRDEIKEPPRQHVRAPKIVKQPAVQTERAQAVLNRTEIKHVEMLQSRVEGFHSERIVHSRRRIFSHAATRHCSEWSWALPVMGTNRTAAITSRSNPLGVLVMRTNFCSRRPTGATSLPPTLSCSSNGRGISRGGAAVRMIAS